MYTQIIIKKIYFFSLHNIRISRNSLNFNNEKILKSDFYKNKKIFNIDNIDVNKILVSKKEKEIYGKYNSFKYFIGYNDNNVIRPLCLSIPKTTGYIDIYKKNKLVMALMVKDKQLLENYKKIWG